MKCPNCSAEWYLSEKIHTHLRTCPFCGTSLQCSHDKVLSTMDDVLCEIIRRFGTDILRDGRKTVAVFSDLAPQLRKERLLLTYLIQFDGNQKLLEVKNLEKSMQRASYLKVVQYLAEEQFVAQTAAESVCLSFLKAIGVTIENPVCERVTTATSPVIKKPFSQPNKETGTMPAKQPMSRPSAPISPRRDQPKIGDYQQYMKILEDYFLQNGQGKLSYQQIHAFVSVNKLDKDWKITCADVEKDLSKVYAKYSVVLSSVKQAVTPSYRIGRGIHTYKEYMDELEQLYIRNGKTMLSSAQIADFLSKHDLNCRFSIVMSDVETDLATIAGKYKTQYVGLHNILQNKMAQTQAGLTGILRKRLTGKEPTRGGQLNKKSHIEQQ